MDLNECFLLLERIDNGEEIKMTEKICHLCYLLHLSQNKESFEWLVTLNLYTQRIDVKDEHKSLAYKYRELIKRLYDEYMIVYLYGIQEHKEK